MSTEYTVIPLRPARTVTIMRGLPGAGKTTWVHNNLLGSKLVCSASDYWYQGDINAVDASKDDNTYKYGTDCSQQAHKHCMQLYLEAIMGKMPLRHIVVDNTNVTIDSVAGYLEPAKALSIPVRVVHCTAPWLWVKKHCRQDIPEKTLKRMQKQLLRSMQNWPVYWPVPLQARLRLDTTEKDLYNVQRDHCPAVGSGGTHTEEYYDDGICQHCGVAPKESTKNHDQDKSIKDT